MSQDEQTIRAHVEANVTAWHEKIRREYPKIARHEPGERTPPVGTITEPILRGLVVGLLRDIIASGVGRRSPDEVAVFVRDTAACALDFTNGRIVIDVPKIVRWLASET